MHEHHMRAIAQERAGDLQAQAARQRLARQARNAGRDADSGRRPVSPEPRPAGRLDLLRGSLAAMRRRVALR